MVKVQHGKWNVVRPSGGMQFSDFETRKQLIESAQLNGWTFELIR